MSFILTLYPISLCHATKIYVSILLKKIGVDLILHFINSATVNILVSISLDTHRGVSQE
jgi:hypothetical protein